MSRKDITVIIPVYNTQPEHLLQAIQSVHDYKGQYAYEIIIVNDGSTNEKTLDVLSAIEHESILVLHQENKGPSVARNKGVEHALSDYILCLDSDNMICPAYIDKALAALSVQPNAAVAYGNPEFIGEETRPLFNTGMFSIEKLLLESYIDMCAVIRKEAWQQCNGLDETLWQYEDWEFWIRLYKAGWKFVHLNETLFRYRVRKDSLIAKAGDDGYKKMTGYLYAKHPEVVHEVLYRLYGKSIMYDNDSRQPLRSFVKYFLKPAK